VTSTYDYTNDTDRWVFQGFPAQTIPVDPYTDPQHGLNFQAPPLLSPTAPVVTPGFVSPLGEAMSIFRLPESGTYSLMFTGFPQTGEHIPYGFDVNTIGDYAIPATLAFMFPDAGHLLWAPAPDPGPAPTNDPI